MGFELRSTCRSACNWLSSAPFGFSWWVVVVHGDGSMPLEAAGVVLGFPNWKTRSGRRGLLRSDVLSFRSRLSCASVSGPYAPASLSLRVVSASAWFVKLRWGDGLSSLGHLVGVLGKVVFVVVRLARSHRHFGVVEAGGRSRWKWRSSGVLFVECVHKPSPQKRLSCSAAPLLVRVRSVPLLCPSSGALQIGDREGVEKGSLFR